MVSFFSFYQPMQCDMMILSYSILTFIKVRSEHSYLSLSPNIFVNQLTVMASRSGCISAAITNRPHLLVNVRFMEAFKKECVTFHTPSSPPTPVWNKNSSPKNVLFRILFIICVWRLPLEANNGYCYKSALIKTLTLDSLKTNQIVINLHVFGNKKNRVRPLENSAIIVFVLGWIIRTPEILRDKNH